MVTIDSNVYNRPLVILSCALLMSGLAHDALHPYHSELVPTVLAFLVIYGAG